MVVDEMFPDGPGNLDYVDAEDGVSFSSLFLLVKCSITNFEQCFGPDSIRSMDPDSESGSVSRRAKCTYNNRKKFRSFMF
jgi:hypothetical protein